MKKIEQKFVDGLFVHSKAFSEALRTHSFSANEKTVLKDIARFKKVLNNYDNIKNIEGLLSEGIELSSTQKKNAEKYQLNLLKSAEYFSKDPQYNYGKTFDRPAVGIFNLIKGFELSACQYADRVWHINPSHLNSDKTQTEFDADIGVSALEDLIVMVEIGGLLYNAKFKEGIEAAKNVDTYVREGYSDDFWDFLGNSGTLIEETNREYEKYCAKKEKETINKAVKNSTKSKNKFL